MDGAGGGGVPVERASAPVLLLLYISGSNLSYTGLDTSALVSYLESYLLTALFTKRNAHCANKMVGIVEYSAQVNTTAATEEH